MFTNIHFMKHVFFSFDFLYKMMTSTIFVFAFFMLSTTFTSVNVGLAVLYSFYFVTAMALVSMIEGTQFKSKVKIAALLIAVCSQISLWFLVYSDSFVLFFISFVCCFVCFVFFFKTQNLCIFAKLLKKYNNNILMLFFLHQRGSKQTPQKHANLRRIRKSLSKKQNT